MFGIVISAEMDVVGRLQAHPPTRFVSIGMAAALEARGSAVACAIGCDGRSQLDGEARAWPGRAQVGHTLRAGWNGQLARQCAWRRLATSCALR